MVITMVTMTMMAILITMVIMTTTIIMTKMAMMTRMVIVTMMFTFSGLIQDIPQMPSQRQSFRLFWQSLSDRHFATQLDDTKT